MKTIKTMLLLLVVGVGGLSLSGCGGDDGVGTPGPPTKTSNKPPTSSPE